MKKFVFIIIVIFMGVTISCNEYVPPVEKIIYVPVKDTISEKENISKIIELEHKLYLTRDSLNTIKDSLGEDLFVANYKLGRIKYYNQVAAKGNNIKFLRGWINRVLNE